MSRREISAGCVVYRTNEGVTEVALIQPRDRRAWALPKGLIEPGEAPEVAAQREAREETGLSGNLVAKLDTIKYSYMAKWEKPPTRVFKIVTFYLLQFTEGDPSEHDREVDRVEWFPIDKALASASYPQEKTIIRKAKEWILNHREAP
jgi:8-oxo-dGTP pyrophosphatase MutT (NUDIX family)